MQGPTLCTTIQHPTLYYSYNLFKELHTALTSSVLTYSTYGAVAALDCPVLRPCSVCKAIYPPPYSLQATLSNCSLTVRQTVWDAAILVLLNGTCVCMLSLGLDKLFKFVICQ